MANIPPAAAWRSLRALPIAFLALAASGARPAAAGGLLLYEFGTAEVGLAAAGYAKGLNMELQIGTNIPGSVEAGQVMQQQLKDIGVNVTLKQGETIPLFEG